MRCWIGALAFVTVSAFDVGAQEPSTAERELLQTHQQRYTAQVSQDIATLEKIVADELQYCHHVGANIDTKGSYLEYVSSGRVRFLEMKGLDIKARVYDNAGVVVGQLRAKVRVGIAKPIEILHRTIEVWVKRGGRWQMTDYQATAVANP